MCYISSRDEAEKIILAEKKLNTYFLNGRLKQTSDTWLVLISSNILEHFFYRLSNFGETFARIQCSLKPDWLPANTKSISFNKALILCKACETLSAIWYHLRIFKNVKNTHGEVLLF